MIKLACASWLFSPAGLNSTGGGGGSCSGGCWLAIVVTEHPRLRNVNAFQSHLEGFEVGCNGKRSRTVDQPVVDQLLEAHGEILHTVFGSNADGIGQFCVHPFQHELANHGCKRHHLDRGHAGHPFFNRLEKFLGDNALHVEGDGAANRAVHRIGKEVENTPDRGRCARGVDRSEYQVPCFGGVNGRHERLFVAHFAHQHDIGIFAHGMLHRDFEVFHIHADLTLIDQAFVFGVNELDGIFEREDVLAIETVDVVEHRGNRGGLSRTGHARQQHHSLIEMAEGFDDRRQIETFEIGNPIAHAPRNQSDLAKLLQHIDAKPPGLAVDVTGMRKVGAPFLLEDFQVSLVHHGIQEPHHLFFFDRAAAERS